MYLDLFQPIKENCSAWGFYLEYQWFSEQHWKELLGFASGDWDRIACLKQHHFGTSPEYQWGKTIGNKGDNWILETWILRERLKVL